jgi:hypothetical protein
MVADEASVGGGRSVAERIESLESVSSLLKRQAKEAEKAHMRSVSLGSSSSNLIGAGRG